MEKQKLIIRANQEIIEKIKVSLPLIIETLSKSAKFKNTGKALLSFISRAGYLNSAIVQLSETKNIYSVASLYRSLIEHNFRHLYIYSKACKEDSDEIGITYCKILKASEDLEWLDKVNKHNRKYNNNKTIWRTGDEHNDSIRKAKKEFMFSKIIEYLKKNNIRDNSKATEHLINCLLKYTEEYNDLSAVVHGGPSVNSGLEKLLKDNEKLDNRLDQFVKDAFHLYKSLIETTYLFAHIVNNENEQHWKDIKDIEI